MSPVVAHRWGGRFSFLLIPLAAWLLVSIAAFGVVAWSSNTADTERKEDFRYRTEVAAGVLERNIIDKRHEAMASVAESALAAGRVTLRAVDRARVALGLDAVGVTDHDGILLQVAPQTPAALELIGTDISESFEHIGNALKHDKPAISQAYLSPALGTAAIGYGVPYETSHGKRIVGGAVGLNAHTLETLIRDATGLQISSFYLIDREDRLIASSDNVAEDLAPLSRTHPVVARALAKGSSGFTSEGDDPSFFASASVGDTGWTLVNLESAATLFPVSGTIRTAFVLATALCVGGLLLALTVGFSSQRRSRAQAELIEAHSLLTQTNLALSASKARSEQFTYSVAHDLREPLRAIRGFSEVLLEDHSESLDETGRDYALRIRNAGDRLAELTDALLDLSRATGKDVVKERTDLSKVATAIATDLQTGSPERSVAFDIQKDIYAHCDPVLIGVVLKNLLENAWKFTSRKPTARISFTAAPRPDRNEIECCVEDDGAGFDQEFGAKLFEPFQRLHTKAEFPGTGIGLATVAGVIEKSGGKTWAEGATGEGARFYFTLPAVEPSLNGSTG